MGRIDISLYDISAEGVNNCAVHVVFLAIKDTFITALYVRNNAARYPD